MELKKLIESRNVEGIRQYCRDHRLCVRGGKIVPIDNEAKADLLTQAEFFNSRQQTRKILLG